MLFIFLRRGCVQEALHKGVFCDQKPPATGAWGGHPKMMQTLLPVLLSTIGCIFCFSQPFWYCIFLQRLLVDWVAPGGGHLPGQKPTP